VKLTRVMSVVMLSISLSSADRSVNPGRTCLACNFSRVATEGADLTLVDDLLEKNVDDTDFAA
jgi:hypothetical protein